MSNRPMGWMPQRMPSQWRWATELSEQPTIA
jgi:hypothetical protein